MRDPKRIRMFCKRLACLWENNVPDWRFGQLIENVFDNKSSLGVSFFYCEDDQILEQLNAYFNIYPDEEKADEADTQKELLSNSDFDEWKESFVFTDDIFKDGRQQEGIQERNFDLNTDNIEPENIYQPERKTGRLYRRLASRKKEEKLKRFVMNHYRPSAGWCDFDIVEGVPVATGHLKYPKNSKRQKRLKRLSNKILRRGTIPGSGKAGYRRVYDYWWGLD